MAKHRTHSIAFKRQVVQEYLAGETLHGLARRHELSRTLIGIWVDKYEALERPARSPLTLTTSRASTIVSASHGEPATARPTACSRPCAPLKP